MELIDDHIVELVMALVGTFATSGIAGYRALMGRIKKLEEEVIKLHGELKLNSKLDEVRNEK